MTRVDTTVRQQPCIHCGECLRACPEALNPETLFFAAVNDDWAALDTHRLDACTECNRCVEVCPSHIPLVDWFKWGKSEQRQHAKAEAARTRFLARNARLARERAERAALRGETPSPAAQPVRTISHTEVLAAIARGKAKVRAIVPDRRITNSQATPGNKTS